MSKFKQGEMTLEMLKKLRKAERFDSLSDWFMKGPFQVYIDDRDKAYQISEAAGLYREADDGCPYGEWQKLKE